MTNIPQSFFDEPINRRDVPALKPHPLVLGEGNDHLFPAGVADMDFRIAPPITAALQTRLNHGVFGYETLSDGLLSSLTSWLNTRNNWRVDPAHILRAPNILNALAMAANLFTNKGDGIIVQPPVFFDFFDILKENHRTLITNPLILKGGRYKMDFDDLNTKAADPKTKMIYLCNPHNPVGRVWSSTELTQLGDICARHNVLVISDEIHGDITFPGHPYTPFASISPAFADNSITCLSPAKTFGIAANCSSFTVISNPTLRAAFQSENSRLTVNKNNAFANTAMEAAYKNGGDWLDAVLIYLANNIALVREAVKDIQHVTLIEPDGTFLLWLDFRALNLSSSQLAKLLRGKIGWAATRGEAFGTAGEGFARLNIACPKAALSTALINLKQVLS